MAKRAYPDGPSEEEPDVKRARLVEQLVRELGLPDEVWRDEIAQNIGLVDRDALRLVSRGLSRAMSNTRAVTAAQLMQAEAVHELIFATAFYPDDAERGGVHRVAAELLVFLDAVAASRLWTPEIAARAETYARDVVRPAFHAARAVNPGIFVAPVMHVKGATTGSDLDLDRLLINLSQPPYHDAAMDVVMAPDAADEAPYLLCYRPQDHSVLRKTVITGRQRRQLLTFRRLYFWRFMVAHGTLLTRVHTEAVINSYVSYNAERNDLCPVWREHAPVSPVVAIPGSSGGARTVDWVAQTKETHVAIRNLDTDTVRRVALSDADGLLHVRPTACRGAVSMSTAFGERRQPTLVTSAECAYPDGTAALRVGLRIDHATIRTGFARFVRNGQLVVEGTLSVLADRPPQPAFGFDEQTSNLSHVVLPVTPALSSLVLDYVVDHAHARGVRASIRLTLEVKAGEPLRCTREFRVLRVPPFRTNDAGGANVYGRNRVIQFQLARSIDPSVEEAFPMLFDETLGSPSNALKTYVTRFLGGATYEGEPYMDRLGDRLEALARRTDDGVLGFEHLFYGLVFPGGRASLHLDDASTAGRPSVVPAWYRDARE